MASKAFMAIIETPSGVWESTAAVCSGNEAEYRAKSWAKMKFLQQSIPPFMTKNLNYLEHSFWEVARASGCKCIVREIEINPTTTKPTE